MRKLVTSMQVRTKRATVENEDDGVVERWYEDGQFRTRHLAEMTGGCWCTGKKAFKVA